MSERRSRDRARGQDEEKKMVRQTIKATFEEQRNEGGALIGELKWRETWDELEKTAGDRKEWRKEPKRLREEREVQRTRVGDSTDSKRKEE